MFCLRQALNRCKTATRWLSTIQYDSSNIFPALNDHQSKPLVQPPTHTNLTMQIMAAANSGHSPTCFQIAAKMKAAGITPDISAYNALMSAVAQDANMLFSWAILDDMLLVGIQPTATTFTHLMDVIITLSHFQVSLSTRIFRRNVDVPLVIYGMHGTKWSSFQSSPMPLYTHSSSVPSFGMEILKWRSNIYLP